MNNAIPFRAGFPLIFLVSALAVLAACNGTVDPKKTADYLATGFLLVDRDRDSTKAAVSVLADSEIAEDADVSFGGSNLLFFDTRFGLDSVFWLAQAGSTSFRNATYPLAVTDSTFLSETVSQRVADSFSIIDIVPPSRIANGNENVSISWRGAAGTGAYAVAAVRRVDRYQGIGYSEYVTTGTSHTINRDAFFQSNIVTPDTGWYYIYVYAISGAPDSSLSRTLLPAPLPGQLADNLNGELSGRFGSVVVSKRDSVLIAIQP